MNIKELKLLKSQMPEGYRHELKKRTNYSYGYIDMIFSGRRKNQEIVDTAFDILKEHLKKQKKQKNILNKVLD